MIVRKIPFMLRMVVPVAVIFIILYSCKGEFVKNDNGASSGAVHRDGKPTEAKLKVSMMLDRYPNAMHAFIFSALAEGYYKEKGLEVDIRFPEAANDPLKLVAAGKVDLALSSQPEVVMARAANLPVKSIAAIVRRPTNYLMIPKSSPIQTPKNLAGKKVGYPGTRTNEAIMRTMVASDGGDPLQVTMTDVKWNAVQAVIENDVDAILGGYINHERLLLDSKGRLMRAIDPALYGVPDYYELVLVASEQGIDNRLDTFKLVWEALAKGQQFVLDHPENGLQYVLNKQNPSFALVKDIEMQSLDMLLPFMSADDNAFGAQSDSDWSKAAGWLNDSGLLPQSVNGKEAYLDILD